MVVFTKLDFEDLGVKRQYYMNTSNEAGMGGQSLYTKQRMIH